MWSGVYTPSLLTILGVIMYLRLGWVVGHAGLLGTIAIVLLAHVISVTTSLSIASLASNRAIGTGGVYYIVSRSLGLPVGGAIGLALYLATALGASLYVIGFADTFNAVLGIERTVNNLRITGTVTLVALTTLTFISTTLALRAQYVIFAAIALSVGSLVLGETPAAPTSRHLFSTEGAEGFATVFAVFFPAVTGFTAGVAMSGDLTDPRKAIPRGTLLAVGTGLVVYLLLPIFLWWTVDAETLRTDNDIWSHYALFAPVITAGIWGATLSSALGSMLGGPRVLQALALDGIGPSAFGRGSGEGNDPRVATAFTFLIAEFGILIGDLDVVAQVLTMFFLTTYGTLNLACALERWSNPDFRPTLKLSPIISFAGAAACGAIMFKLDAPSMAAAIAVLALVYALLKRRLQHIETREIWAGIWESLVRSGLRRLRVAASAPGANPAEAPEDSQGGGWRPNMLLFGGNPARRPHLIQMAHWVVAEHGMLTNFELILRRGDTTGVGQARRVRDPFDTRALARLDIGAQHNIFHTARRARSVAQGVRLATEWFGLVGMEPNSVMLGWPQDPARAGSVGQLDAERARRAAGSATTRVTSTRTVESDYTSLVSDLMGRNLNLLVLQADERRGFGRRALLDVWWGTNQTNGGLMLMLAHYIRENAAWARSRMRVVTVVHDADQGVARHDALKRVLSQGRVRAEVVVLQQREGVAIADLLQEASAEADLVIMGLSRPAPGDDTWLADQRAKSHRLRACLRVAAASHSIGGQPIGLSADVHLEVDEPDLVEDEPAWDGAAPGALQPQH